MSGFDKMAVDAAFWGETGIETNFICSFGKGNGAGLFPRLPRLSFEDAAQIL
jgi:3-hydroxypropanoate dehydrogenase